MNRLWTALVVVASLAAFLFVGCDTADKDIADQGGTESAGHDHGDPSDETTDMDRMRAELAKLSPEDAASAEAQHICPVTDEMLGTMGPPKKVDVDGRQVWICCEGCRDPLLENPTDYLAKLDESE